MHAAPLGREDVPQFASPSYRTIEAGSGDIKLLIDATKCSGPLES